jgi:hypothetical protein
MRFFVPFPVRYRVLAGAVVAVLAACGSNVTTGDGSSVGGAGGACLQSSDVCVCLCGGFEQSAALSSQATPSCSGWQGQACSIGDGGSVPSTYTSCSKTGTKCWSP